MTQNSSGYSTNDRGASIWPLIALVVVAAIILVGLQLRRPRSAGGFVGRSLPQLDAAGWINADRPLTTEDLRGKVVLIDFWATWCGPCREAMPDLVKLKSHYGPQGLTVIGLTSEANKEGEVKTYVESEKEQGLDWPIAYGTWLAHEQMGIEYLPTFVLFDRTSHAVWGGSSITDANEAVAALLAQKDK